MSQKQDLTVFESSSWKPYERNDKRKTRFTSNLTTTLFPSLHHRRVLFGFSVN